MGIFFVHANFIISWPTLGVSVFYVMSGFLMMYAYGSRSFDLSVKNNFIFSLGKIKKLYPLHILTMLCAIVLTIARIIYKGVTVEKIIGLIRDIFLNIALLQTWIPDNSISTSLNGVAWYLSVTLFLYFMFPYLVNFINKTKIVNLCLISILILMFQVLLCIPFIKIFGENSEVYIWFMYSFPVFRLGDFFIGSVLKKIYERINIEKLTTITATVIETIATLMTVLVFMWLKVDQKNIVLKALHNWTTIYIPLAVVWVYLFSICRGILTKAFTNKLFIYIGNISSYAFLIHFVITQYVLFFLKYVGIELHGITQGIVVFVELLLSIFCSVTYRYLHEHCVLCYSSIKKSSLSG